MLMTVSDFAGFFARNHFMEGGLHFSTEGGGCFSNGGASFLSSGDAPEGASILMGGGGSRKIVGWGEVLPTMRNPAFIRHRTTHKKGRKADNQIIKS